MNRLHSLFFVLFLLLSQWGSIDHVYHVHDTAEVCDYCLSAHALDHAVLPSTTHIVSPSYHQFLPELLALTVSRNNPRYYSARAPPRFI